MIARCPTCNTGLDITGIPPGNAVACGACGNSFWIAGGASPPPPPAPAPSAPPQARAPARRSAPTPAPAPAPRRSPPRAAPAPVPAPTHAAARPGRRKHAKGGAGRNPVPLLLGFGAVVAVVAGGLVFVLGSGGRTKGGAAPEGTPGPAGPSPPAAGPAAAPAAEVPKTPLELKAEAAGLAVPAYLDALVRKTAENPVLARRIVEDIRGFGRHEEARLALDTARKAHPHDPWLNEQLGLKDRTKEIQDAASDVEMLDLLAELPAFQEVVKLKEQITRVSGSGWLDDERSRALDRWLAECREQVAYLSDPVNAATNRILVNMKYDPDFAGIRFTAVVDRPFVVLVEEEPEPARRDAVRGSAERAAQAMVGAYGPFLRFLREELGLTEAPRLDGEPDVRLRAVMFRSRASFDRWNKEHGEPVSAAVVAYYTPVRQMVVMHADMDWATPSGVKGLPHDQSVCMHEAVHQLFDWYQRWFCDRAGKHIPEGEAILNPMRSSPDTLFWFQEGLADYFGASRAVPGKTGVYEPGQPDRRHLAVLGNARTRNEVWKVADFLFADQTEIHARAARLGWGRGGADNLTALMYSHGWALVHFLLHGEGGRWRPSFTTYLAGELKGDHFRMRLEDLVRDLPEFKSILEKNPDLEYALKDRRDLAIAMVGIFQKVPELAALLRTRDLLGAFGMKDLADPRAKKWMEDLQAGYRAHCETLLREAAK